MALARSGARAVAVGSGVGVAAAAARFRLTWARPGGVDRAATLSQARLLQTNTHVVRPKIKIPTRLARP
jgi:hypothetical protein